MKYKKVIIAIILIISIVPILLMRLLDLKERVPNPHTNNQTTSIIGCYKTNTSKDIYTMKIDQQDMENISGTLSFKNFEKDSSNGTFSGTYKDGILLVDYMFQSEGTQSKMQVIFKKVGESFVRGYGDLNADGTQFVDLNNIKYDDTSILSVFQKGECSI